MNKKPLIISSVCYRPKKILGLLCQALIENQSFDYVLIDSLFSSYISLTDRPSSSRKFSLFSFARNLYLIYNSSLVFGKVHPCLRLLSKLFFWNGFVISIPPGKITKGIGFFKSSNLSLFRVLSNLISTYIFNLRILATDTSDAIYLSSAHAYPINHILPILLPKHIYIQQLIFSSSSNNGILFAPTERQLGAPSPISTLVCDTTFVDQLLSFGLDPYYSHHPHDQNILQLDLLHSTCWNVIGSVVTDYSSIGSDFLVVELFCYLLYSRL